MTTRTAKKTVRKKATNAVANTNKVTLTATQARNIQNFLAKKGKTFAFLDKKLSEIA